VIKLVHFNGNTYRLSLNKCRTWEAMEKRIKDSCHKPLDPDIENGRYELVGVDDEIILPRDWEDMVEPGMIIKLRLIPSPQEAPPETKPDNLLPDNAKYVEVKLRTDSRGNQFYRFESRDGSREVKRDEWERKTIQRGEKTAECWCYKGKKTGHHFWTWTLDNIPKFEDRRSKRKHTRYERDG